MNNNTYFSTNVSDNTKQNPLNKSLVSSRAKIEETNGKIYVIIDGRRIEADRNDLFGMNKANPNEWLEKLVKIYDDEMQKNYEKKSFLEKQEEAIKTALKKAKKAFWALLAKFGVKSLDQIPDYSGKIEAAKLNTKISNLSSEKTSVGNSLYSVLMDNFMAACDKGKYSNQLAFNNAITSWLITS